MLKNDTFKTRDFSPLIERVLADVLYELMVYMLFPFPVHIMNYEEVSRYIGRKKIIVQAGKS